VRWIWIAGAALVAAAGSCQRVEERRTEEPVEGDPVLPGVAVASPVLDAELRALLRSRAGARPRTRHLQADGSPRFVNRLVRETSPYLLQHAHNPVNWYAWGDEPFERARREGKPVLLSVGYSTCHWCHVMERESFEDEEVARILNEHYVCIKVDREERPDVDLVYMKAVQAMNGSGGWPMTVLLTADRQPFFGATYLPRDGFLQLLERARQLHRDEPARLIAQAGRLAREMASVASARPGDVPGIEAVDRAVRELSAIFDDEWGGFGRAPKFPQPPVLELLLRHHRRTRDRRALEQVLLTLESMARGGIRDHVGGGFHRYSTDPRWLVPHFEKMLYDNAQLAAVYVEAYQASGRAELADIARGVLDYLLRDMISPEGGFHSATDADSPAPGGHDREGHSFTWTPAEIEQAVGAEDAAAVTAWFAVTAEGQLEGRSILHTPRSHAEVARGLGMTAGALRMRIDRALPRLAEARARRPQPLRDDKIVTSWNGLAISALARAALALGEERYAEAARRAAGFLLSRLRGEDGRLRRSFSQGRVGPPAVLDDHAFLIQGLLDLFEATGESSWLDAAIGLQAELDRHFLDTEAGGYFMTAGDGEKLLVREKPVHDGAEPSGNAVALLNLLRLEELTSDAAYRSRAEKGLGAFASALTRDGPGSARMLCALDYYLDAPLEIVLVAPERREEAAALLAAVGRAHVPNRILVAGDQASLARLARRLPIAQDKPARRGQPTAYVCVRGACDLPTSDPALLTRQLGKRARR
jgi:uncharacterized protein YyaL (SSP411 family)